MSRVFLVRHGQTDWNAIGRLQGASDVPLNDAGRAQALATAEALSGLVTDATVVSSHLMRAAETAQVIAGVLGVAFTADARLAERSFGVWEGTTIAEREQTHPVESAQWHAGEEPDIAGYETHARLEARMLAAVTEHADAAHADLVVVSHGSAVRRAMLAMGLELPTPPDALGFRGLGNGRWCQLEQGPGGAWELAAYNVGPD